MKSCPYCGDSREVQSYGADGVRLWLTCAACAPPPPGEVVQRMLDYSNQADALLCEASLLYDVVLDEAPEDLSITEQWFRRSDDKIAAYAVAAFICWLGAPGIPGGVDALRGLR